MTFPRLVQPVLDAKCVACHEKEKAPPLKGNGFPTLKAYAWGKRGGNGRLYYNERSFSLPGQEGARVSKLYELLAKGHHGVELTAEEMRRITLWLDCNSNFYGAYRETEKQERGDVVRPLLGVPAHTPFEKLVR